jgi:hypothetical protein
MKNLVRADQDAVGDTVQLVQIAVEDMDPVATGPVDAITVDPHASPAATAATRVRIDGLEIGRDHGSFGENLF